MTDHIQRLIAATPFAAGARLEAMEAAVWARVGEMGERRRMGHIRIAVVALAAMVGVANGGLMMFKPRPQPPEMRIFTVSSGLSPLASPDILG